MAIRPHSKNVAYTVIDGTTVELRLAKPEYLSVEFDDDHLHNLHLFANPLFIEEPVFSEKTITWQGENAQDAISSATTMPHAASANILSSNECFHE